MGVIRILSDPIVNKIAAGEVIERPASVVKELIENAIDAHASQIDVSLELAGTRLIRVTDDGRGIGADDLRLAVLPHATSKIADESDLEHIATMGFRGEALASIGSVSQMRIVSRPHDGDAHEISIEASRPADVSPAAAPPGTTVEVRNLFYNVPARRKFLRSLATEIGHITEQISRIAMAYPHIGITITHNGKTTHRLTRGQSLRDRITAFHGRELADALIAFERSEREVEVRGFAAPPAASRATARWQMIFVNGRFIRDRTIQHAIREAFRGLTEVNRHPVVFLFIDLPPDRVDVNVHPTKIEVRWRETGLLHSMVLSTLRETLGGHDLTPAFEVDRGAIDPARREAIISAMADFFRQAEPPQKQLALPGAPGPRRPAFDRAPVAQAYRHDPSPPRDAVAPQPGVPDTVRSDPHEPPPATDPPFGPEAPLRLRPGKAMQVHNMFLVLESDDGLLIVDQHALHERILFEQLAERVSRGPLESQQLLLPETVDLTDDQMSAVDEHADLLERLGLRTTRFGPNTVAIQSCPLLLSGVPVAQLLTDVLDRVAETGRDGTDDALRDALNMMACKAAVKAGDPLTETEVESLLAQRGSVDHSSNCPHGRPTTLRLTVRELERQFRRT